MVDPTPEFTPLTKEEKRELYQKLGTNEIGYTIGILNYTLNVFCLGRFPQYFWILHMVKGFIFIPWRWIRFLRCNYEWYLVEFCYFNTYFAVLCCILAYIRVNFGIDNPLHPYNHMLIRIGFVFANGSLLWAIWLFNNKLVFHDVDNTCSVYIHLSPALLFWSLRWGGGFGPALIERAWPDMFHVCPDMYAHDANLNTFSRMLWEGSGSCSGSVTHLLLYPVAAWFVLWCVPYSLLVFCCFSNYLEKNGKCNVYRDTINATTGFGGWMKKTFPRWMWPAVHMTSHLCFTIAFGALAMVTWNSFVAHTALLSFLVLLMIHNGSTYTFRIVAAKEVQQLMSSVRSSVRSRSQDLSNAYASVPTAA